MPNRRLLACGWTLAALAAWPAGASAASGPTRVGQCASTRVEAVGFRLGTPGSGSTVMLANGVSGVSYDQVPAVDRARPGDPAVTCLVSVPRGCPPGDERGRIYRTTDRRTGASWQLPNAEHLCGGA